MITLPIIVFILALLSAAYLGYLLGLRRRLSSPAARDRGALEVSHLGELGEQLEARRKQIGVTRQHTDALLNKGSDATYNMEKNKVRYNAFLLPIQYARILGYNKIVIHFKPNPTQDDNRPERESRGRLRGPESPGGDSPNGTSHHAQ